MKNKKYHTVGTIPKLDIEIVESGETDTTNTQIHFIVHFIAHFIAVDRNSIYNYRAKGKFEDTISLAVIRRCKLKRDRLYN